MRTFIENYLHFMKNCIRPHYEKLNPLKSGFIENSNFENNRDPGGVDNRSSKKSENVTCTFVICNHWSIMPPDIDQCHNYRLSKRAMSLSPSLLAIQDDDLDEDERASLASSLQSQFGTPLFGLSPSEEVFLHTARCSIHGRPAVI